MSTPKISIITIVYNGLPYLKECVESVLAQDFMEWELLISDDGSSDGTQEYITGLNDYRIKAFIQRQNLGIFGNLNFLFSKAQAPVCQILCQDDYFINPSSLSQLVSFWEKAPSDIGIARFNHGALKRSQLFVYQKAIIPSVIPAGKADLWFFLFGNIMGNLSNVSLRQSIFEECGRFSTDLPYAGDFEFWSRAARKTSVSVQSQEIVFIRRHPGVASNYLNRKGELFQQKKTIVDDLYQRVRNQDLCSDYLLKLHGTLQYDVLGRDTAIKFRFKGNRIFYKAFKEVSSNSSYTFGTLGKWVLYIVSAGGRIGRTFSAKCIVNNAIRNKRISAVQK